MFKHALKANNVENQDDVCEKVKLLIAQEKAATEIQYRDARKCTEGAMLGKRPDVLAIIPASSSESNGAVLKL